MTNIILCGGVGSRLWPLSRAKLPKQFASLLPGETLFESTVRRNRGICDRIMVASNAEQAHLAARQLIGMGITVWDSVVEPCGRNTAPAIALAAMMLPEDELVLVSPSDHVIADQNAYGIALEQAKTLANQGKLVTLGIKPEYPETGFGYIELDRTKPFAVSSFTEKPNIEIALSYLKSGNFYWNSGMFCFRAGAFLKELQLLAPQVYDACANTFQHAQKSQENGQVLSPVLSDMSAIPAISIDYAVMEKTQNAAIVTCDIGWSDLGSFDALIGHLTRIGGTDSGGNASHATQSPVYIDSRNNLVISGNRQVALVDVDELIVVDSPDALLVTRRNSSQRVKEIVDQLKSTRPELI